ncbi:MAG TPA: 50S ribosomal protein L25, partial [Psychrobacter sp.]|nr:50S ribosomal protein L25 [Psychrobacter sp.]
IKLPEGVIIFDLDMEDAHDRTVVNMQPPTVEEVDEDADEVDAADVPATEQCAEPEDKDAE